MTLSPPLLMAALFAITPGETGSASDVYLPATGAFPPDLDLLHRLGRASHLTPAGRHCTWPFAKCASASELIALAVGGDLLRELPEVGDIVVLRPEDREHPRTVAVVSQVTIAGKRGRGPTRCRLTLGTEGPRWDVLHVQSIDRWCGTSRGDVIIRWGDLTVLHQEAA